MHLSSNIMETFLRLVIVILIATSVQSLYDGAVTMLEFDDSLSQTSRTSTSTTTGIHCEGQEEGVCTTGFDGGNAGNSTVNYVFGLLVGMATVTGGSNIWLILFRVAVLYLSAYLSTPTVSDSLGIIRSATVLGHSVLFGFFGDPHVMADIAGEYVDYLGGNGFFPGACFHFATTLMLLLQLVEALNLLSVVSGSSRNRWHWEEEDKDADWWAGVVFISAGMTVPCSLALTAVLFTVCWVDVPWSTLGSFRNFGMGLRMSIFYLLVGLVASAINWRAKRLFENDPTRLAAINAYYEARNPSRRDDVTELLRTRHLAPVLPLMVAINTVAMIAAMDAQNLETGFTALIISGVTSAFNIANVVYSIQLLRTIRVKAHKLAPSRFADPPPAALS